MPVTELAKVKTAIPAEIEGGALANLQRNAAAARGAYAATQSGRYAPTWRSSSPGAATPEKSLSRLRRQTWLEGLSARRLWRRTGGNPGAIRPARRYLAPATCKVYDASYDQRG
jgi:hypothetical protein